MIGKKIRYLLEEKGVKQVELAKYAKISPSRLSNYLSDKREPELALLAKMAKFLGADLNYFSDVKFCKSATTDETTAPESDNAKDCIYVPFIKNCAKKRGTRGKKAAVGRYLFEHLRLCPERTILFEVASGMGSKDISIGDCLLAEQVSETTSSGMHVFELGRNSALYTLLKTSDSKKYFLVKSGSYSEVVTEVDLNDLRDYYAISWILKKCIKKEINYVK